MADDLGPRLLSLPQVARDLGVSTRTVRRLVERKHLHAPVHIEPRVPRWSAEWVRQYKEDLLRGRFENNDSVS